MQNTTNLFQKRLLKRMMALTLTVCMVLTMSPTVALAADTLTVSISSAPVAGVGNESNYTTEYTVSDNDAVVDVTGSTENARIIVAATGVTLNLSNVTMNLKKCNGSAIEIQDGKSATIVIDGENTVASYAAGPGILVGQGAAVTIKGKDDNTDKLTVQGAQMKTYSDGEVSGGQVGGFAGIGSKNSGSELSNTGTINIESGTIHATGYGYGAGIGGGDFASGGIIHISGGNVTAINGGTTPDDWQSATHKQASGIGASQGQASGEIVISGNAKVTAYGGSACAGIGGGTSTVTIKDTAAVEAHGGENAAGIGGYNQNKGQSTISIEDTAVVTAYGGSSASGLGQGSAASPVNLKIADGATVTAYSDGTKAAITGTPCASNASILNIYLEKATLPAGDITLHVMKDGKITNLTVPSGYQAIGTNMAAGDYTVSADVPQMGTVNLYGVNGTVTAGNTEAAYSGVQVAVVSAPDKPTITSTASGNEQVTVTWTAPTKNNGSAITGYKVYYSTIKPDSTGSAYTGVVDAAADATTAVVTGLTNNTDYYFWVKATNAAGESTRSSWWDCAAFADGSTVDVSSVIQLEAALDRDDITDINAVGSFAYGDSITAAKNITVKNGQTLTLTYKTGYFIPKYVTTCNSNLTVESGAKIVFNDACSWAAQTQFHSYFVMNGNFTLKEGATAETTRDASITTEGYILFRGGFANQGGIAVNNANVYLNYGTEPGTFTGAEPKYNLCLTQPAVTAPNNQKITLTSITGDAYVDGKLHVSVDGFGEVKVDGLFPIQWGDDSTNTEYTVKQSDEGTAVIAKLNGTFDASYGYYLVTSSADGTLVDEITAFDTAEKSINIAAFAITFDANGGTCEVLKAAPDAAGKLTSLPVPTRTGNYRFDGWFTEQAGGAPVTLETVFTESTTIYAHWTYNSGDSGSSSGGSTTKPPVRPTEPVTGSTENNATVDGSGNANVVITDKNIADTIADAKAEADKKGVNAGEITAVINVTTGGKDATTVSVNLPKVVQEQVIGNKIAKVELVIDRPDLTIGMNLAAVAEINKQAKADVQISASKTDATVLSTEAKAVIGNRPAYDLKATYQSGGKSIKNFGTGTVSIKIPYKLQSGEKAENIYAVYVDGNGKVTYLTNSSYDIKGETLMFSTNHFSVYGVGFKEKTSTFTDIENHWAKDDIEFVVSRGIMSGTSNTTFSPDSAMTRGMFVTALGHLAGADVSSHKQSSFSDVKADSYYMGYIEWANKSNIVVGIGGGKFAPDSLVTREQMAVIMKKYATAIGFKLPEVHAANTFADNDKIGTWAAESVKHIQMAGIISGKTGNVFDPQGTATRAEVSTVLRRFVELSAYR